MPQRQWGVSENDGPFWLVCGKSKGHPVCRSPFRDPQLKIPFRDPIGRLSIDQNTNSFAMIGTAPQFPTCVGRIVAISLRIAERLPAKSLA